MTDKQLAAYLRMIAAWLKSADQSIIKVNNKSIRQKVHEAESLKELQKDINTLWEADLIDTSFLSNSINQLYIQADVLERTDKKKGKKMTDENRFTELISNANDLYENFFLQARLKAKKGDEQIQSGWLITTKVRKEVLTSTEQGKIALEGKVFKISFPNLGGGVYRAHIPHYPHEQNLRGQI